MSILDSLQGFDLHDRTTQIAALGGVLLVGYAWHTSKGAGSVSDAQAAAADAVKAAQPDLSGANIPQGNSQNYPGWVGYPELPSQSPTTPAPQPAPPASQGSCGAGKVAVWRNGKLTCQTASANAVQQCPPGYAPIKSSAGTRCTKVNEWGNTPGPTSFIPVDLTGTYRKGYRGSSPGGAAGQAFPAVRGINPQPAPLSHNAGYTVRDGDTLASISRRLYGASIYWPKLVERNGAAAADLTVGDRLTG